MLTVIVASGDDYLAYADGAIDRRAVFLCPREPRSIFSRLCSCDVLRNLSVTAAASRMSHAVLLNVSREACNGGRRASVRIAGGQLSRHRGAHGLTILSLKSCCLAGPSSRRERLAGSLSAMLSQLSANQTKATGCWR